MFSLLARKKQAKRTIKIITDLENIGIGITTQKKIFKTRLNGDLLVNGLPVYKWAHL